MRSEMVGRLSAPGGGEPLRVVSVARRAGDEIVAGSVLSPEQGLYPIGEGILQLLPHGAGQLSAAQASNLLWLTARGYERPWRVASLTLLSRQPLPLARERAIFDEMLGEVGGGLWLDLAASTGLYGRWLGPRLVARGGEVVCLDLALPMLRVAQRAAAREGHGNLSFVAARGEQLPFATGTLAGVVCGGSLNEFGQEGAPRVLQEVARALRPGGVGLFMHLLVVERAAERRLQEGTTRLGGVAFWGRAASTDLFEGAGLQVEQTREFGIVAFSQVRRVG